MQSTDVPQQLSLLDQLQKASPGTEIRAPVTHERLGGRLPDTVSRGLYTNPLHSIREYVQNGIDAKASEVTIKVTANSVFITDDGSGMTLGELDHARDFGISKKDYARNVGFRGIGIYSSFHLCDRLIIITKQPGVATPFRLTFEWKQWRDFLAKERAETGHNETPFTELATRFTHFDPVSDEELGEHGTFVQLESVNKVYLEKLADRSEMRKYIRENLPIAFAADFPGKRKIESYLAEYIEDYNAATIVLESEDQAPMTILRPSIPALSEPQVHVERDEKGGPIFLAWSCLYESAGYVESEDRITYEAGEKIPLAFEEYRGFVYKVRGFTIGNNRRLKHMFKRGGGTLYDWYTGEIYVLDPEVVPTAERADFEDSPNKSRLELRLQAYFKKLEADAAGYQVRHRAWKDFFEGMKEFAQVNAKIESKDYNPASALVKVQNIYDKLESKKRQAGAWTSPGGAINGKQLLARVKSVLQALTSDINRTDKTQEHAANVVEHLPEGLVSGSAPPNNGPKSKTPPPPPEPPTSPDIMTVLADHGWEGDATAAAYLSCVDAALADVLGRKTTTYAMIVSSLQARLAEVFGDTDTA